MRFILLSERQLGDGNNSSDKESSSIVRAGKINKEIWI